jgi:hypothetical protein
LNGRISFGTFLDCTLNKHKIPSSIQHINQMETILFQIETTHGIKTEQIGRSDSRNLYGVSLRNVYVQHKNEDELRFFHNTSNI